MFLRMVLFDVYDIINRYTLQAIVLSVPSIGCTYSEPANGLRPLFLAPPRHPWTDYFSRKATKRAKRYFQSFNFLTLRAWRLSESIITSCLAAHEHLINRGAVSRATRDIFSRPRAWTNMMVSPSPTGFWI